MVRMIVAVHAGGRLVGAVLTWLGVAGLAMVDDSAEALTWTERLVDRWQQGKDPRTGLCGGQLSYREHDRAREALGHIHPTINEAKSVSYFAAVLRISGVPK
ncbi:MAG: hypothetical protein ACQESR_13165 [Planctomycetota bacterium]